MKFLKNNLKLVIGILIGAILTGGIVYAATSASEVTYKDNKSVSDALDDLYNRQKNYIYTETDYQNYGTAQYNKGASDNGGVVIPNWKWKADGYNKVEYELGFEPRLIWFYEEETDYTIWAAKGDDGLYYTNLTNDSGRASNYFSTTSTGFSLINDNGKDYIVTLYVVK